MRSFVPIGVISMLTVLALSAGVAGAEGRDCTALDDKTPIAPAHAASPTKPPVATLAGCTPACSEACAATGGTGPAIAGARDRGTAAHAPASLTEPRNREQHAARRDRAPAPAAPQAQRTPAPRDKGPARELHATPGMGALVRIGTRAGREISHNVAAEPSRAHREVRTGRAPPDPAPLATHAPAAPPRDKTLAASPRAGRSHAGHGALVSHPVLDPLTALALEIPSRSGESLSPIEAEAPEALDAAPLVSRPSPTRGPSAHHPTRTFVAERSHVLSGPVALLLRE